MGSFLAFSGVHIITAFAFIPSLIASLISLPTPLVLAPFLSLHCSPLALSYVLFPPLSPKDYFLPSHGLLFVHIMKL